MSKIVVTGPVIVKEGKILLVLDDDKILKLPGGKAELNESLEDACRREAKEEINGDVSLLGKLSTFTMEISGRVHELHHFLAKLKNEDVKPLAEVKKILWVDIDKLGQYYIVPNIKYLLERGEIK